MSDTLPGSSSSNPIVYRDYEISLNPNNWSKFDRWGYMHKDYDGDEDNRHGYCETEADCKAEIDEALDA